MPPLAHQGHAPASGEPRHATARDVSTLRLACAEEPGDAARWAALAAELAGRGTRGEALRAADTAWRCVQDAWERGDSPRAVSIACMRADLLGLLGRDAEALAMFDAIAARSGDEVHPDVPYRRARLLADTDPRAALAQYRVALSLDGRAFDEPVSPGATSHASLLGLARLALALGRTAMARELALGAARSPGAPPEAQVTCAECDIVTAPDAADAVLSRLPAGPGGDVPLLRAACAETRGDEEGLRRHMAAFEAIGALDVPQRQARAIFLRVAARVGTREHMSSTDVQADCAAAAEAIADGKPERAVAYACAALRVDPTCSRAWMSLILSLRLAGRPGYSVLAARGAVHALPSDADVRYASALAHEAAGDPATAVADARTLLGLRGHPGEARGILARAGVHAAIPAGDAPAVSVVVRIGEQPDDVVRLLDRLALQEPGGPGFEVVLCGVEGHSVLVLPGPRPYRIHHVHARTEADGWNAGWRAATAPVVLFLEPDAVPGSELLASCLREHARFHGLVRAGARLHPHRSDTPCAAMLFTRRQASAPVRLHGLSASRSLLEELGGCTRAFRHTDALATDLWTRAHARGHAVREAVECSVSRRSPSDAGVIMAAEEALGADAVTWLHVHGTPAPWDETLDDTMVVSAAARVEAERNDAEEWAFVIAQACHVGPSSEPGGRAAVETCIARLAAWRRLCGVAAASTRSVAGR
jgi:tetratricopeptide (TPR) repeat protein